MLPASILSLALASIFFAMLRLKAPRWTYVVLGLLPPASLLLASPSLRVYGYHGFLQAGIVYQILQGNIPPTSPLLAGQPGTYPWAGALVLAGISWLLGISPFWAASLVAIASLAVLLVITYRIGLLVDGRCGGVAVRHGGLALRLHLHSVRPGQRAQERPQQPPAPSLRGAARRPHPREVQRLYRLSLWGSPCTRWRCCSC